MDELTTEELQELEEKLYSQVHHQFNTTSAPQNKDNDEEETEKETSTSRFLANRYWADKTSKNKTLIIEHKNAAPAVQLVPNPFKSKKVRNPLAAVSSVAKQNFNQKQQKRTDKNNAPFAMKNKKLEHVIRLNDKKQKSTNARKGNQKSVDTVVLDLSDDEDDEEEVIHVPLPPNPIYTVDDSDDETNAEKSMETTNRDAIDNETFTSPKSVGNLESRVVTNDIPSRCNSPNSVISQDDFIGQGDCRRLTETVTLADDEDLLNLTNNTDSLMEPPSPAKVSELLQSNKVVDKNKDSSDEIECLGTFIKPAALMANNDKNRYRVDQGGFRAMDVYESESDIVSDGVYSKATSKSAPPTPVIRNIDNSSDEEIEDISISQAKMKRLRKRRASGSCKGSESNGGDGSSDDDDDGNDGVADTAVPFISRGPAVESYKSKRFRKRALSTSGRMSDTEFMATLNSLSQGSNTIPENAVGTNENSETGDEEKRENVPTARDIAEKVLNKEKNVEIVEKPSTSRGKRKRNVAEEAVPEKVAENVEDILNKINELNEKRAIELSDEDICNATVEGHFERDSNSTSAVIDLDADDEQSKGNDEIEYFLGYSQANKCTTDGLGWNEEMHRFYNWSWGEEHITEDDILRKMNRDRRQWVIIDADRYPTIRRDRREKCINCLSFGHVRARCPKPRRPLVCYMCGEGGHLESRCPNTRCLRCGGKTSVFTHSCKKCMYWNNRICPICKLRGHSLNDCPDKWRRYHSTTQQNMQPNSNLVYNKRRYCCYCGRRGHLLEECRKAVHRSEYPITSCEIKSHEKSYDDVIINPYKSSDIPCRLFEDPNANYELELAEKTTPTKLYGRFLTAVGLANLIGKKRGKKVPPNATKTTQKTTSNVSSPSGKKSKKTKNSMKLESPEQVPEVSESQSEHLSIETSTSTSTTATDDERLQMPPPPAPELHEPIADLDSDSNYSFSDHFEPASTSNQRAVIKNEPLPDFIPIGDNAVLTESDLQQETTHSTPKHMGISLKFVENYTDDDDDDEVQVPLNAPKSPVMENEPCEAKIYISDQHSKYFQSQLGQAYLTQITTANNLIGRLNKTIVGYALFIHGLPADQEKFQAELETKFKSLNNEKMQQYENSSKVPKHVNVLIRFLRDSINQLYTNLGNASELYKRLIELDKQNSKSSNKSADRIRRTLNMIFLGQAGLSNGVNYFDTILKGLTTLINNHNSDEKTPEELRNEIDMNWRKLFTPYHHKNYAQLLLTYLKLPPQLRNRLPALNIERNLLGLSKVDVSLNNEQITRLNESASKQCDVPTKNEENDLVLNVMTVQQQTNITKRSQPTPNKAPSNNSNNSNLVLNVTSKEQSNKTNNQTTQSNQTKNTQTHNSKQMMSKNVEKPTATTTTKTSANISKDINYDKLLSEICNPKAEARTLKKGEDCKAPSSFWSRESLRFITCLINRTQNSATAERLARINEKALNSGLSYNDYRAVIKLYNATVKE